MFTVNPNGISRGLELSGYQKCSRLKKCSGKDPGMKLCQCVFGVYKQHCHICPSIDYIDLAEYLCGIIRHVKN